MRARAALVVLGLASITGIASTREARADEPLPATPALTPPPAFPRHFVYGNGLALVLTSLSVGYQLLPAPHHAFGLDLHGQYGGGIASELLGIRGAFVGAGTELGYRFYGSREGPYGPFVGASFLTSAYHTQQSIFRFDPRSLRYLQYGPAVDVGWALRLDRTIVVALSLGAQYTFTSVDPDRLPELTRLLVGDGPRPRAGIQVGRVW